MARRHAARLLDLGDVSPRPASQVVGEPLDVERPAPRVDHLRGARLLLEQELRVARDAGREVGGQRQRLVQGVGVQALRVALGGGHGLDARADDVVVDVLRGERPARGLRVRAQRQRLRVLRRELVHQLRPQQPCRPQLRDLHEEVHADAPEERQARGEHVDAEARVDACAQVLDAVGERVGELEVVGGPGLLDVVAGDGDRVELRHLPRGEREDVGDDLHRRLRRVDVGVADHELLEDVVLDGPGELGVRHTLLLRRHDVEREHRQHGAVHRHRHRHAVQRDAVEQLAHVVDRVDRDARHADIACDARVVGVVAAVGGQVEGDRKALLACGEVAPVEGVRLGGRGEAGVLADGPRLGGVHRRVRAAQVGRDAGIGVEEVDTAQVGGGVERLDGDALRRIPHRGAGSPLARGRAGLAEIDTGEVGNRHAEPPAT